MTRNRLCALTGAVMLATSALHASQAAAQTQQQIDWCNNNGNAFSVDQRLVGCTALVESERASVQDRAARELALQQGKKEEATRLFRIADEGCPNDSFQLIAANTELKALGAQP